MKKTTKKKLELTTTTIKVLTEKQLQMIAGGASSTYYSANCRASDADLKCNIAPL